MPSDLHAPLGQDNEQRQLPAPEAAEPSSAEIADLKARLEKVEAYVENLQRGRNVP